MKRIGFIDYYLDEWHANNLPTWIREETNGETTVAYAYAMIERPADAPEADGVTNREWAEKQQVQLLDTIEEVVEKSDVIVVLSPNNPEMHEQLCDLPLRSGKPTYVDKTFAPDVETACRIIQKAIDNNTPMFTSSALRFSKELKDIDRKGIRTLGMRGPGPFDIYSIHQVEPVVSLMGGTPEKVMFTGTDDHPGMVIRFSDNRWASTQHYDWNSTFNLAINYDEEKPSVYVNDCTDFFPGFVTELVHFFRTGEIPIAYEETLAVTAILQYAFIAQKMPGEWVDIPSYKLNK